MRLHLGGAKRCEPWSATNRSLQSKHGNRLGNEMVAASPSACAHARCEVCEPMSVFIKSTCRDHVQVLTPYIGSQHAVSYSPLLRPLLLTVVLGYVL